LLSGGSADDDGRRSKLAGFSEEVHALANVVFLAQALWLAACLARAGIWLLPNPQRWNAHALTRSWAVRQFFFMLGLNSLLYLAEFLFTNLLVEDPLMSLHHLCALLIFAGLSHEPFQLSAVAMIPFALHPVIWFVAAQETREFGPVTVLNACVVYNISMVCVAALGVWSGLRRHHGGHSILVAQLCFAEAAINLGHYCAFYDESLSICHDYKAADLDEEHWLYGRWSKAGPEHQLVIAGLVLAGLAVLYMMARTFIRLQLAPCNHECAS
jgi:hypothetical protein